LLFGSQIESEDVALQELLLDHLVKDWRHSFFSESWVGHSDDGFKVAACEDSLLFLYVSELLVFYVNLAV